jgi:hypothetical protein
MLNGMLQEQGKQNAKQKPCPIQRCYPFSLLMFLWWKYIVIKFWLVTNIKKIIYGDQNVLTNVTIFYFKQQHITPLKNTTFFLCKLKYNVKLITLDNL